jgi:hypothetical protein
LIYQILIIAGMYLSIAALFTILYRSRRTEQKLEEIHLLVNSQLGKVLHRVMQLTQTLDDAGVDVPVDPHKDSNENAARNLREREIPDGGT